jgi:signal transduction histidine kinase
MAGLLRNFFAANHIIVLFIYGQVFFVLGLSIALQSWRHSRLALARHLNWLAAFGFAHGLNEWGDVFIPIQAQYMAMPFVELLSTLQSVLLAVSFACLFQFGVETLRPLPGRWQWLRYLPATALALWAAWQFGPALANTSDTTAWRQTGSIVARYGLGFPGGLLAAYGLRRQARELIAPLQIPHILRTLQVAGLALAGYSVMAGLVVPPGPFFPANWLNTAQVEQLTAIPVPVYRSLLGLILALCIIHALEVFRVELDRRLSSMEEMQILVAERERIGRELHDGTLQTIYAAGLLLQATERELTRTNTAPGLNRLQQSMQLLNQAVADIRGYIGTLRAAPDSRSLAAGLQELATTPYLRSLVDVDLALDLPEKRSLSPAYVGHLLAIANEALSNVARHAQATQARLSATAAGDRLRLEIQDNGRGLPPDYVVGYGLRNMHDRARLLGGKMSLVTQPGHGTTVTVDVPWGEENEQSATLVG